MCSEICIQCGVSQLNFQSNFSSCCCCCCYCSSIHPSVKLSWKRLLNFIKKVFSRFFSTSFFLDFLYFLLCVKLKMLRTCRWRWGDEWNGTIKPPVTENRSIMHETTHLNALIRSQSKDRGGNGISLIFYSFFPLSSTSSSLSPFHTL